MALVFKRAVQVLILQMVLIRINASGIIEDVAVSKLQKIPSYRFHYYARDEKNEDHKQSEESNNGDNVHGSNPNGAVPTVDYYAENSSELQTDVTTKADTSLFKLVLNDALRSSQQTDNSGNSTISPINVKSINTHEQKSVKVDSIDHLAENFYSSTQLTENVTTNQPEVHRHDVTDEQITDQTLNQSDGVSNKIFELRLPLEKQSSIDSNDKKYFDDEVMRQNIVKVIDNIKDREQSDPQLHLTSLFYKKLLKITDALKTEPQEIPQTSLNKPLQLLGYDPATIGSLYNMKLHHNQTSQIQKQLPSGLSVHGDKFKQRINSSSTIQQEDQKYLKPIIYTQLYYYDPNLMIMFPISNGIIHNIYPFVEIRNHLAESRKKFNINNIFREKSKRSIKIPNGDSLNSSGSIDDTLDQISDVNYNGHKQFGSPPTNPDTSIDSMPICSDCGLGKKRHKRSVNVPVEDQISPDTMKMFLGQPPQVNYNGHKQFGSPPTNPDTSIDSMPICNDCGLGKKRHKRSVNIPVNDQISPDSMKISLGQPPQVHYNGHKQFGSPPTNPDTSIASMPICTDCGLGKIRHKRSVNIPVDDQISPDSMKMFLGQPPQVNYNGHKQFGSPPTNPDTSIDSMPICTDCGLGRIRHKRSVNIPVDDQISLDSMKMFLDQPPQVHYNGHNQFGSPPTNPDTSIDNMPICTDCGLGKIRHKRSVNIPEDDQITTNSMKMFLGQPPHVNYNGHKQFGSPPTNPDTSIDSMPICSDCGLGKKRHKRSVNTPVDDQISLDSMKMFLDQPPQVHYNGHKQFGSPPTNPDTSIDSMPICTDCGLGKIRHKRSVNIPVNDQISPDSMKISLGQPPQVNYNGHTQFGSPPTNPDASIDSMPICTDCGLGKIRHKRSVNTPVDDQISPDSMKIFLGQPPQVNYNGHKQFGSPPTNPDTSIDSMPICTDCGLGKIRHKRSVNIPVDDQISPDSMKMFLGQPPQVNYNGHKQFGSPPTNPDTSIDSMPICTDCDLGKIKHKRSVNIPVDYQISPDSMKIGLGQPPQVNYNGDMDFGSLPSRHT